MNLLLTINARYKLHGRTEFNGLQISVETDAGRTRSGVGSDGKKWSVKMTHPYGYIRNTMGVDGDHVDCFIGPDQSAKNVYVMHVTKGPDYKKYDEDKCMLGFPSAAAAKKALLDNYSNPKFFGSMTTMLFDEFKKRVLETKDRPQKLTKIEQAVIKADGEPNAGGTGYGHYAPVPTFRPPSLRNSKRVPADDPGETDDQFLDVTKRTSKDTQRFRTKQMKKHTSLGGIPPNTAVQHHTGVAMPIVSN
jgi:hypothetical protein